MSMEDENIIDTFFKQRQEDLLEEMSFDRNALKTVLKQENRKRIQDNIDEIPEEYRQLKENLTKNIEDLISNYEIKMAYYDKKYYKQGFQDAIMIQCCCKEKE